MALPNVTEICVEYQTIELPPTAELTIKLTLYVVTFLVAVVGNILAMSVVLRNSHLKTSTNIFIVNLACSDLLIAMFCMPSSIHDIATHNRGQIQVGGSLGSLQCKMMPFLQGVSMTVASFTVTSIAFDRFLAIVYPFKNLITVHNARCIILINWIVSIVALSPLLYAMTLVEHGEFRYCDENWEPAFESFTASTRYTIFLFVIQYAVPLVIITALYSTLIKDLWNSSRVHSDRRRAYKENKAVLKMLITIIITFAVCWLPMHVTLFVSVYSKDPMIQSCGPKAIVLFLGWFFGQAHSACNPVIYFIFNEKFRKEIRSMMQVTKAWFGYAQNRDDEESSRGRRAQQTVSFDLKRISFSSLRESSGKRSNGTCNAAIEVIEEEKQNDNAASSSPDPVSLLSETDERALLQKRDHMATNGKAPTVQETSGDGNTPGDASLDKNSNVNLDIINIDVNSLSNPRREPTIYESSPIENDVLSASPVPLVQNEQEGQPFVLMGV